MNDQIFFFFYSFAHQSQILDGIIIFFAMYFIYLEIFLAGLFLLFYHKILPSSNPWKELKNKWKEFIVVVPSVIIAYFFNKFIAKIFFHVFRPFIIFSQVRPLFPETGYAFPSGHTAVASALAFALFFTHKKAGYVFMFFALLIGIARVVAGVHFPVDILGGFILGALVAYFIKNV